MPRNYNWDAIKTNHPIADVIGEVVTLKKRGDEYLGCCPFHSEKTPSFHVIPAKEFFHCFGCGASGDVVDFVAKLRGLSTIEAIEALGGDETLEISAEQRQQRDEAAKEREERQESERRAATFRAEKRWDAAAIALDTHPYLKRKGVPPHICRLEGENLLLPIYGPEGALMSVQTIAPDGGKLFQAGAPTKLGRMMIGLHFGYTIVCEGFATGASIHEAMPEQVCVTFSKGNMAVVARQLAESGTPIILAADTNAGDEMAALAKELDCPVAVPEHGGDFNDQALELGLDSVAQVFADAIRKHGAAKKRLEAEAKAESAPVDLWAQYTPPPIPAGLLPPLIERFAHERAGQMGVDPGGLAMSALTVCAAAIRDSIKIKVKQHEKWTESARIWTMLIGDPSFKKSPIMRAAAGKIKEMDAGLLREGNRKMQEWSENGGQKNGDEKPQCSRLRVEDITMEACQEVCQHSPDGILVLQDELSGWFGGIEKYSGGKGAAKDRSFWLTAFGGGQYAVNRIGRGSFLIDNLSVTILGGVQPDPIRKIVADASDDGLIQRFFPIVLQPSSVGKDEEVSDVAYEYDALVERLHGLKAPEGVLGKLPLQFSDEARSVRERLERKHHKQVVATEGFNRKLAAHIGKFDGLFPRLCIIWHCIENVDEPQLPLIVSGDTAERVSRFLTGYLMRHSLCFYSNVLGLADDHSNLQDVGGYILAHRLDTVTMRTLQRGSRQMRRLTRDEGAKVFEQLEALGWLEQTSKRSDAPSWAVKPEVHTLFEGKAEEERLRRQDMRQAILEMIEGED